MNIGYFGGSFDPIHSGHLAVARAAADACRLDRVLFVPTDAPPHKRRRPLTAFIHRYAMVALALAEARDQRFVPSLLEAPDSGKKFHYSIDTIRALRRQLKKDDRLFFLIGIDAFAEIAQWRQPEKLLRACEFVVSAARDIRWRKSPTICRPRCARAPSSAAPRADEAASALCISAVLPFTSWIRSLLPPPPPTCASACAPSPGGQDGTACFPAPSPPTSANCIYMRWNES